MTMQRPRVTIGMAVYNGENYIREAIESILNQTFTDFELIISDNASTDGTKQICEHYAAQDSRIKYSRNTQNLGAVPNLNRTFELASGEYFKWSDHDDILAPEFLEQTVAALDRHTDVIVCYPRVKLIDADGNFTEDYDPLPNIDFSQPHIRFGRLICKPDGRAIQTMGLIRSSVMRRTRLHGSYPSSDEVLMAHLGLIGRFMELPDRLIYYRIHPKQSTKGILASERARVLFVDTSLRGKLSLIKWPYLLDCLKAIHQTPLSTIQRLLCYTQVFRWLLQPKNIKSITKDILLASHTKVPLFSQLHREVQNVTNQIE